MSYTHNDKVCGTNGLAVGANDSEVVVADSTGVLYQGGTEVTATAAEINTVCDGVLTGTATEDVASIAADASDSLTITVTGAALGDFAIFSAGVDLAGLIATCYVSAADTVTVNLENQTAGAIDLASTDWKAMVFK